MCISHLQNWWTVVSTVIICGTGLTTAPAADWFTSDKNDSRIYSFDESFTASGDWDMAASGNSDPDDIFIVGNLMYVLNTANSRIYRYTNCSGDEVAISAQLKNQTGGNLTTAYGMAIDGDELWVADDSPRIYRYSLSAAFSGATTTNAQAQFPFSGGNLKVQGLALSPNHLYVLERDERRVFRYSRPNPSAATATASGRLRSAAGSNLSKGEGIYVENNTLYLVNTDSPNTLSTFDIDTLFASSTAEVNALFTNNLPTAAGDSRGIGRNTAPSAVSFTRHDTSPTSAGVVQYVIQFSEPVSGIELSDFVLTTTGSLSGVSITDLTADTGTTRIVTISSGTGDGSFSLTFEDNDSVTDGCGSVIGGIGTGNGSYTAEEIYEIKKSSPKLLGLASVDRTTLEIDFDSTMSASALAPENYSVTGPGKATLDLHPSEVADLGNNRYRLTWTSGTGLLSQMIAVEVDSTLEDVAANPIDPAHRSASATVLPVSMSLMSVE